MDSSPPLAEFEIACSAHDRTQVRVPRERQFETLACDLPAIENLAAALHHAFDQADQFPPPESFISGGDRVTIALDPSLPDCVSLASALVSVLRERVRDLSESPAVLIAPESARRLEAALRESLGDRADVIAHDPADDQSLAYLAADEEARPIYFHRRLCDVEVVLPVIAPHIGVRNHEIDLHSRWIPAFANRDLRQRFAAPPRRSRKQPVIRDPREEAQSLAWLLGVTAAIAVSGTTLDRTAAIVYGDANRLGAWFSQRFAEPLRVHPTFEAELVIAEIDAPADWFRAADALRNACRAGHDHGAIVIWSDLQDQPTISLRADLADEPTDEEANTTAVPCTPGEAAFARVLNRYAGERRIYLRSRLTDEAVERFGLIPLTGPERLDRLLAQHNSALLIRGAHRLAVSSPFAD